MNEVAISASLEEFLDQELATTLATVAQHRANATAALQEAGKHHAAMGEAMAQVDAKVTAFKARLSKLRQ